MCGWPGSVWVYLRMRDRKSTRLNSSHDQISYAVFCLKKKKMQPTEETQEPTFTITGRQPSYRVDTLNASGAHPPAETLRHSLSIDIYSADRMVPSTTT